MPPLLFVFASLDFLDDLVAQRQVNHSTVAIQELMHTVGVLDPSDGRTASVVDVIGNQIRAMPPHRTFARDIEVLGRAALLSGILCRLTARTVEAVCSAIGEVLQLFTPEECASYLANSGYGQS